MADDYGSTPNTAGALPIGTSLKANFETPYDNDWFKVTLQAGSTYLLGVNNVPGTNDIADFSNVYLYLRDANGAQLDITSGYRGYILPTLQFTAPTSGTYYVSAESQMRYPVSYQVTATLQADDDIRSDPSTTAVLPLGGQAHGSFEVVGDRDWFKFHAEPGQHLTFGYSAADTGAPLPGYYRIYDAAGVLLNQSMSPFEPLAGGDYFLSVEGTQAGAYVVNSKIVSDDYSGNDSSPGQLAVGGQAGGTLQFAYDVDRFKVSLQAGVTYAFDLNGDAADMPAMDLEVLNGSGVRLQPSFYTTASGAHRAVLVAPASATYSIDISKLYSYQASAGHGPYTVAASAYGPDEYGGTPATAATLQVGGTFSGLVQSTSDTDMFQVALQAGTTYVFALKPTDSGAPGSGALSLALGAADGTAIGSAIGTAAGSYAYTPQASGTYTIAVADGAIGSAPLAYSLQAMTPADDFGANAAKAGLLQVGANAGGNLELGADRDWFAAKLVAGSTYWFSLAGLAEGVGTLWGGSQIKVLDAQGHEYASQQGSGNGGTSAKLSFAPSASGTYYIEVSGPGATGTYQVKAEIGVSDDYGNDVAHAAPLPLDQATRGKIELGSDHDVFRLDVVAGSTYGIKFDSQTGTNPLYLTAADAAGHGVTLRPMEQTMTSASYLFYAADSGSVYFDAASGWQGSTGSYTLNATSYGTDDYAASSATTAVLPDNGSVQGTLNYGDDSDWIKVHLEAGKSYTFSLHGVLTGGGTLPMEPLKYNYVDLVLHGAERWSYSGWRTAYTPETSMAVTAETSGDYYIEVSSANSHLTGSYTLTASSSGDDGKLPTMTSITAGPDSSQVGLDGHVVMTFSEPVRLGWSTLFMTDASGGFTQLTGTNMHVGSGTQSNVLTVDLAGVVQAGGNYTLQLSYALVTDLAGHPNDQIGDFHFQTALPQLPPPAPHTGGSGNDRLDGSGNGSVLDGGAGIDTALYAYSASRYQVLRSGDHVTVTATGASTPDTLKGIERLHFSDADVALDIDGHGGQAYRLYQAAFNRKPDLGGVGYWINALDQGGSLRQAADNFVNSQEFRSHFGGDAPTDAQIVDLMYQNVLHRAGDKGGVDFWLTQLHNGAKQADLLMSFSESAENAAALIGVIGNGFAYTPVH